MLFYVLKLKGFFFKLFSNYIFYIKKHGGNFSPDSNSCAILSIVYVKNLAVHLKLANLQFLILSMIYFSAIHDSYDSNSKIIFFINKLLQILFTIVPLLTFIISKHQNVNNKQL